MIVSGVPSSLSAWRDLAVPVVVMLIWDVGVTWAYMQG